jgi:hypothetical protein
MTTDYFLTRKQSTGNDGIETPTSPTSIQTRSNPLATKVTSVLSASYADSDIRDALSLLDIRGIQNSSETRRQIRLDVQKEVIESNGDIIREFGHVAEVQFNTFVVKELAVDIQIAIETYWPDHSKSKSRL